MFWCYSTTVLIGLRKKLFLKKASVGSFLFRFELRSYVTNLRSEESPAVVFSVSSFLRDNSTSFGVGGSVLFVWEMSSAWIQQCCGMAVPIPGPLFCITDNSVSWCPSVTNNSNYSTEHPSWRTTSCQLSETVYSTYEVHLLDLKPEYAPCCDECLYTWCIETCHHIDGWDFTWYVVIYYTFRPTVTGIPCN